MGYTPEPPPPNAGPPRPPQGDLDVIACDYCGRAVQGERCNNCGARRAAPTPIVPANRGPIALEPDTVLR